LQIAQRIDRGTFRRGRAPRDFLAADIARGDLEVLLPEWSPPKAIIHAVFPSRRGLLPAVRHFIDFLAIGMKEA
jgi:DNA-binding transcriptional LysR family regulator